MKIGVPVTVPLPIYEVYVKAASEIENYTAAKAMSDALEAYVHTILSDMLQTGALTGTGAEDMQK